MKVCAGLLCLGALLAAPAWAVPCGVATLDVYIGFGNSGCTLGSLPLTFKDFGFSVANSGGNVVTALSSEITVTPTSGLQGALEAGRLTFTSPRFNVAGSEFAEYLITYTVDPPPVIIESDLDMSAESPVAPGRVNILQDLCIGAPFFGTSCDGTQESLNVFHNGTPAGPILLHDDIAFAPTNVLGVRLHIDLRANGASSNFDGVTSGTLFTPEPAPPLAIAGGLLALAALRRRAGERSQRALEGRLRIKSASAPPS